MAGAAGAPRCLLLPFFLWEVWVCGRHPQRGGAHALPAPPLTPPTPSPPPQGPDAVVDVLLGEASPSGRLAATWYHDWYTALVGGAGKKEAGGGGA